MKKIILDTNFLLIPGQFKVDIFDEIRRICDFQYKLYIVDKTIDEINSIIETAKKSADKRAAKLALELIKAKDINIICTKKDKSVDDLILDLLDNGCYIVATQDKPLKTRIKSNIISLRQKKYLELRC
ncbi:MAG: nucleotide-binding protein [Nanoarchaeota archaeon]|nr:nucleotide-binding protein [Nanoarchaeota archaeon]